VPRRLLPLAALVVVVSLGAGCAEDVAPAARAGDAVVISNDDLMAEAKEWVASPKLLEQVGITTTAGAGPGSYASPFVGVVLTNRIRFDLNREQFDALGLTLTDDDLATSRAGLFPDPSITEVVLEQLTPAFGDRLVEDLARVTAVSEAMGDGYEVWFASATSSGIEVSSRYGSWDRQAGAVVPPAGPRPAPAPDQLVGA